MDYPGSPDMAKKGGISGFGRICRNVLRSAIQYFPGIQIVPTKNLGKAGGAKRTWPPTPRRS